MIAQIALLLAQILSFPQAGASMGIILVTTAAAMQTTAVRLTLYQLVLNLATLRYV